MEVEMAVKVAGKAMINMEANAMQRQMDLNKKIVDSMLKTIHKIMPKKPKTMIQEVMKKTTKIIHGLVRRKIPEFTTNLSTSNKSTKDPMQILCRTFLTPSTDQRHSQTSLPVHSSPASH